MGSLNQDITVKVARFPQPGETLIGESVAYRLGGKGANQAVAAARAGADVWFIGRIGADPAGETLRRQLSSLGVHDGLLTVDRDAPTGSAHITVDADGENEIVVVPGANAKVDLSILPDQHPAALSDVFVTQGEIPAPAISAVIELGRLRGAEVVLNLAPAIDVTDDMLRDLGLLVVNESEAGAVLACAPPSSVQTALDASSRLLGLGVRRSVITLGRLGAVFAATEDGATITGHIPAPTPRHVTDTTGAGDAAVGVMAAALGAGLPLEECVRAGVRAGTTAVEHLGAASGYPSFRLTDTSQLAGTS